MRCPRSSDPADHGPRSDSDPRATRGGPRGVSQLADPRYSTPCAVSRGRDRESAAGSLNRRTVSGWTAGRGQDRVRVSATCGCDGCRGQRWIPKPSSSCVAVSSQGQTPARSRRAMRRLAETPAPAPRRGSADRAAASGRWGAIGGPSWAHRSPGSGIAIAERPRAAGRACAAGRRRGPATAGTGDRRMTSQVWPPAVAATLAAFIDVLLPGDDAFPRPRRSVPKGWWPTAFATSWAARC